MSRIRRFLWGTTSVSLATSIVLMLTATFWTPGSQAAPQATSDAATAQLAPATAMTNKPLLNCNGTVTFYFNGQFTGPITFNVMTKASDNAGSFILDHPETDQISTGSGTSATTNFTLPANRHVRIDVVSTIPPLSGTNQNSNSEVCGAATTTSS